MLTHEDQRRVREIAEEVWLDMELMKLDRARELHRKMITKRKE